LNIVDSTIRASSNTANAVTASVGTVVTLMNNQIVTSAADTVARVSIAGYHSIISVVYDKANSTLSNSLNSVVYFQTVNVDSLVSSGVVSPEKGFVYTPRMLGAQTAITIDFATNSMIRATYSSTLTISFSNYTYGKVVEAWITNTAGTGQTINLGVLANNSTTGSATLSVASNRSAKLQYFSIDGDLANTFCAITYA
jgi:hypothetical protein